MSVSVGSRDKVWVKVGDYAGNADIIEVDRATFLKGDCDLNGVVTGNDALLALRHALGLITLEGEALLAGDVDGNGVISGNDALLILRFALGLLPEL